MTEHTYAPDIRIGYQRNDAGHGHFFVYDNDTGEIVADFYGTHSEKLAKGFRDWYVPQRAAFKF